MDKFKLVKKLETHSDKQQAEQMKKYMRSQFKFFGIQSVKRRELSKPLFSDLTKLSSVDWELVDYLWDQPYRECQYIVCDYLNLMKHSLTPEDVPTLKRISLNKSWWDTIDSLDKVIGAICMNYPAVNETMLKWSTDNSIWLRRIAINHQRHRKELMDTALLEKIIRNNLGNSEFFINKAIGWILRDYSKTNPKWVKEFISKYKKDLHPLSIREGSKFLKL